MAGTGRRQHGANLDGGGPRARGLRRPVESRVEVRDLDDEVAAELLLGVGHGPVLDEAAVVLQAQRGGGVWALEAVALHDDARLGHGADEGGPAAPVGLGALGVGAGREVVGGLVEEEHELNGCGPWVQDKDEQEGQGRRKPPRRSGEEPAGRRAARRPNRSGTTPSLTS